MRITEIKGMFPFNRVEAYHKDLGYSIPVDEMPEILENATVTHFTVLEDFVVIAYCEG